MITKNELRTKRVFDFILGLIFFLMLSVPIFLMFLVSCLETREWGIFKQERIGQYGRPFKLYKIRTLKFEAKDVEKYMPRMGRMGRFFRSYKLDELPQLWNIIIGDMSFVGPRPDLPGFADELKGEDRIILELKPGLTGPATLKYQNEEALLADQDDPDEYNQRVIWPDKVKINKAYLRNWSFCLDLKIIFKTIWS